MAIASATTDGPAARGARTVWTSIAAALLTALCSAAPAARLDVSLSAPAASPAVTRQGDGAAGTATDRRLQFEPNLGQADPHVRYIVRGSALGADVHDDGLVVRAHRAVARSRPAERSEVRLRFVGANRDGSFSARAPATARSHYLVGADASRWITNVPRYHQLRYAGLYPGIDLVYYSRDGELEYDLVVQPHADPAPIRMQFSGAHKPRLDARGDLLLDGRNGRLRLQRPLLYQHVDGERKTFAADYVLLASNQVALKLPEYDRSRPLVIDPVFKLLASTYVGGVHDDAVGGVALDRDGNAYVVGNSASEDFAVSANAYQAERKAIGRLVSNVVVAKFSPSGTLLYSTFLGGTTNDFGRGIAVDAEGRAHITGDTQSADFPTTAGALQATRVGATSAFVATLSPDGSSLVYSTLLGGSGGANGSAIALDAAAGHTVVAGSAGPGLPTTAGAYKPTLAAGNAAFVARIDARAAGAAQLVASTYYGTDAPQTNAQGLGNLAFALALGTGGSAWITGQAYTTNLPTTAGAPIAAPTALDPNCTAANPALNSFAYVAQLSADLRTLAYASYLSGKSKVAGAVACSEYGHAIAIDAAGSVYVGGVTASNAFPATAGTAQPAYPGAGGTNGFVSFVSKLTPNGGAIQWSSYVGGNAGNTFLSALALDAAANAVWSATVTAGGANFPISADALQRTHGGNFDAAATQLDAASGALKFSTLLGGGGIDNALAIAIDANGNAFIAGSTTSLNFPVTSGAFQPNLTANAFDGGDWFVSVLGGGIVGSVVPRSAGNAGDATLRITGVGFDPQATCTLSGVDRTLAALSVAVQDGGRTLACTFALAGAPPGSYDVTVTNPDGSLFTRSGAFTVQPGSGSDLSVEVLGRATIRTGVPSDFTVVVTNDGDADALGVVLNVRYSAGLRPVDPSRRDPFDLDLIPIEQVFPGATSNPVVIPSASGGSLVPLFLPLLPSGGSASFVFRLVAAAESDDEFVEATVLDAFADSEDELARPVSSASSRSRRAAERAIAMALTPGREKPQALSPDCLKALWDLAWDKATGQLPGVDCYRSLNSAIAAAKAFMLSHPSGQAGLLPDFLGHEFKLALDCAGLVGVEINAAIQAAQTFLELMKDAENLSDKCKDKDKGKGKKKKKKPTKSKGSIDPNDKYGPVGDGSAKGYISTASRFAYQIAFENLASAGLPAAEVVVTDQLDTTKFDLSTLALGSISWGPHRIDVPPGLNNFATIYSIDPTLSVRVQGSLDSTTGVLKWTFTTLDPATRLPPSDPTLGFLPPNRNGTEGQGYVNFTIAPKAGMPDGTAFSNQASIVFDLNAPIVTPTWTNTLDFSAPTSKVDSVVPQPGTMSFVVNWSGSDAGSGARSYSVFVSDNGGPFTAWQSDVTTTSATYDGVSGRSYAFHVIATDGAGNTEAAKSAGEASIAVNGNFGDPGGDGGGGCTLAADGQRDGSLPLLVLLAAAAVAGRRRAQPRSQLATYSATLK